jgi:riboflavin biosynthesis pyrimidine reductase
VIVNMVMSADGKVVVEGNEKGIGSKADQRLMRELRVNADMTLNGAETLRRSGASPRLDDAALEGLRLGRGLSSLPRASILSRSGDLPLDRPFFTASDFEAQVYLSDSAPPERKAAIAATGRPVQSLPTGREVESLLGHAREKLSVRVLLVEGGPTINRALFDLEVVDEYFLTLGPVVVGGARTLSAVGGEAPYGREDVRNLGLVSAVANEATGEVYLRYRARRGG